MIFHASKDTGLAVLGRKWRFAQFEFDESSRVLSVGGETVELESKPVEVLLQLLLRAGEVVSKEELLESAWPGVTVVEGSLATAISKLRKALGDDAQALIVTVPRAGYRIGVPVQSTRVAAPAGPELGFAAGNPVADREGWRYMRKLGESVSSEVWLTGNTETGEQRVLKYAADGIRLKGLKREVTLGRLLREALGDRPDFVRVVAWNFETAPFWIESEYGGDDLSQWAERQGGLPAIPWATRRETFLQTARAVAAAHRVGILHKDLKPANVLISETGQVKVADFGSGALADPDRLADFGITNLGFTRTEPSGASNMTGTLMYLPPEVLAGHAPTALGDVYALGVILYQLAAGDFRKPLSPGWEADVDDPLLREDIAAAAAGDAAKRLGSVDALIEHLERTGQRRAEREELEAAKARAAAAERRLAEARARRPWMAAAVLALVAGLAVSLWLYASAARERDRANHESAIAASVSRFLGDDLIGRTDPFQSGHAAETLSAAVSKAAPNIDRQFRNAPDVAARLHHTIGRALDNRSDYAGARPEYQRAAELYRAAGGELSQDAIVVELQRAAMEARAYQTGTLPEAKARLAAQEKVLARIAHPRADIAVWLASARGMIALIGNDAKEAAMQFRKAFDSSGALPEFDENARLTFEQRLAFSNIRLGNGVEAERLFRGLATDFARLDGPESPNVLRVRLNLAQAFMIQNKNREAIEETRALYPLYVAHLGEDHELTLQLLATLAQCEGTLEMWDDAIRDDGKLAEIASRKAPDGFLAIAGSTDEATAQCRSGRLREGEANARSAWERARKAFGERAGLTGGAAFALAGCEIEEGKLADASKLLLNIDRSAVAQLAGFPDWGANVSLELAEIAYRQSDYGAAKKLAAEAAPGFAKPDAEAYQKRRLEQLQAELAKR